MPVHLRIFFIKAFFCKDMKEPERGLEKNEKIRNAAEAAKNDRAVLSDIGASQ